MATVETSSPIYAGFGDGMGMGGGSWIWAFLIFALCGFGGNGFGFGNRGGFGNAIGYENLATANEVQRGFDNQNAMANQREILAAVNDASARGIAATQQTFHDTLMELDDKYNELSRDNAGIRVAQAQALANQNQCCCDTKMLISETAAGINAGIAQSRYDAAMNTAAINANTVAQTQRILDMLQQNKIESLQSRVNQLETKNMLGNVVRYPTQTVYSAGGSPFCNGNNGNCGCNSGCGYPIYA